MEISNYSIEELINLRDKINSIINNYDDNYIYIVTVRSYGRTWKEHIHNTYTLQELCYKYDGYDGIVDIYSTNPDLSQLHNYGTTMYIKSEQDYQKWEYYEELKRIIPEAEKNWEEWDNRDNIPFNQRPYFQPIFTKEDIQKMKTELEKYDMNFTPPTNYTQDEN